MNSGYRNSSARAIAATMGPSDGGSITVTSRAGSPTPTSATANDFILHGFDASTNSVAPGESVDFTLDLENQTSRMRAAVIKLRLDDVLVLGIDRDIAANSRRTMTISMSYSDLLTNLLDEQPGAYTLSLELLWPDANVTQNFDWGTLTLEPPDPANLFTLHSFGPTRGVANPGDNVQFVAEVENTARNAHDANLDVQLNGQTVTTENVTVDAGERRPVANTLSYTELRQAVGGAGSYTVSADVTWDYQNYSQSATWGSMTISSDDSNDGGGGGGGGDDGSDGSNGSNGGGGWNWSLPDSLDNLPTMYLVAGGGAFAFLFLLVLIS